MTVLEAMWLGRIDADRCPICNTPEYIKRANAHHIRCEAFCDTLTPEQMKALIELEAENNAITEMEVGSIFGEAFKLGAKLMLEILSS